MNKKILYLVLLDIVLILPFTANGATACGMINNIQKAMVQIGITIVVIGWVIAGLLWLLSGGSPDKTGTAKKATIAAIIGTAIIALSTLAYDVILDLLGFTGGETGCK